MTWLCQISVAVGVNAFLASWNRSLSYRGTSMSVWLSVGLSSIFQVPKGFAVSVDNFEILYTCSSYLCRKTCAIRFSKFSLFIFSWFYVWQFTVNVSFNIISRRIYSGTLRVETSRCRISLPGKHANIAKLWDLFRNYTSSTHLKSKSTTYMHMWLKYKYPLKLNCHIFRPIPCEKHVVW